MDRADKKASPAKDPFTSSVENFYMTDVISRSSQMMAKCVVAKNTMPGTAPPGRP